MRRFAMLAILILLLSSGTVNTNSAEATSYPPGIMFSTLLNGVKMNYQSGDFYLDHIQATFLPQAESNSIYPYNPDDGGALWAIVTTDSGEEIARFDFYAELLQDPYWLLNSYNLTDLRTGENPPSRIHLDVGSYLLDFYVEGEHFYHFPFTVAIIPSSDPFTPGDYYFLEGDWSDWGYFYYYDAEPDRSIHWKFWLRNKAHDKDKNVEVRIEVKRGGALICTSRENCSYGLDPEWVRFDFDLISPMEGTSGGGYFKAEDLLAVDGSYTLKIEIDGELYGTWGFSVTDGHLDYTGRTIRGVADSLTFVEGGRDAWWYGK